MCHAAAVEKRDADSKQLLIPGILTPAVGGVVFDGNLPKSCCWFAGRELDLMQLRKLLTAGRFSVTGDQKAFLAVMRKYRCRIVFTSRSGYERQIAQEVKNFLVDKLLARFAGNHLFAAKAHHDLRGALIRLGMFISALP